MMQVVAFPVLTGALLGFTETGALPEQPCLSAACLLGETLFHQRLSPRPVPNRLLVISRARSPPGGDSLGSYPSSLRPFRSAAMIAAEHYPTFANR